MVTETKKNGAKFKTDQPSPMLQETCCGRKIHVLTILNCQYRRLNRLHFSNAYP